MANSPMPSVRDIIPVPLPRPLDRVTIVDDPAYAGIQKRLMSILSEDSADTAAA
jgi:hypothetical protein